MVDDNGDDLRELLSDRPLTNEAADYFLEHSPMCECEAAPPVEGGHGRVSSGEILSMYLGSPRHSREKYNDDKAIKEAGFPYKSNLFDAAFGGGLSVMREHKATDSEIQLQAKKIAVGLQADDPNNGFFSILQFDADVIFSSVSTGSKVRQFCVYDTPIDVDDVGNEVFSHADIFPAGPRKTVARTLRTAMRILLRQAVASNYEELAVSDYRGKVLSPWESKNT